MGETELSVRARERGKHERQPSERMERWGRQHTVFPLFALRRKYTPSKEGQHVRTRRVRARTQSWCATRPVANEDAVALVGLLILMARILCASLNKNSRCTRVFFIVLLWRAPSRPHPPGTAAAPTGSSATDQRRSSLADCGEQEAGGTRAQLPPAAKCHAARSDLPRLRWRRRWRAPLSC